jgi:predicted metal-dependent hydrolase
MASIVMDESKQTLAETITAVLSPRDSPSRVCCDRGPTPQMVEAFEQFNRGLYWEQHETLERVWRAETDTSIRNFYKGVIQVGVGFHHITRHNYVGVMKVLARGINYLKPYAPECYGVDVARLMNEASEIYFRAKELGPEQIGQIKVAEMPKIHYFASGLEE